MARDKTDTTDLTPPATLATTATRATNEWGIPDWRDASAYGDTERWTTDRWQWEFYRRRDDLRAYFDERAEATYQYWSQFAGRPNIPLAHLRPDEPGFYVSVDATDKNAFGYNGLPNPRIGEQPAWAIWPVEFVFKGDYQVGVRAGHVGSRGSIGEHLILAGVKLTGKQKSYLGKILDCTPVAIPMHGIALKFNLDRPLESQLKQAREILRKEQKDLHGKPLQTSTQRKLWLIYLRALDAREATPKASWREIAIALLSMRKDEAGEQVHARETKARDTWKAANTLRFKF